MFIELYALKEGSLTRGILTSLDGPDDVFGEADTGNLEVTAAMVKMSYNAAQKVVTTSYDRDGVGTTNGWQVLGSFGLGGAGGSTANRNWNLPSNGNFALLVGGFSQSSIVTAGKAWVDDFAITVSQPPITYGTNSFGFDHGQFGFNITGPNGAVVVIEGSTNLVNWIPLRTNTIGSGPLQFSDPQSTTNATRYYRLRTP